MQKESFSKRAVKNIYTHRFVLMDYTFALSFQILKEFVSLFVFLVALSRIAQYSFDATGIILFLILIVFDFPLLNPHISFFMFFAVFFQPAPKTPPLGADPEQDRLLDVAPIDTGAVVIEEDAATELTDSMPSLEDVLSRSGGRMVYKAASFCFIIGFQFLGGYLAGLFRIYLDKTFGREVLTTQPLSVANMPQFVAINSSIYTYNSNLGPGQTAPSVDINSFSPILQQGSTPWYGPVAYNFLHAQSNYATIGKFQTSVVSDSTMVTWYITEEMFAVALFLMGLVNVMAFFKHAREGLAGSSAPPNIVPVMTIFMLCVLVVSISYAFPTAHCNSAVTVYLLTYEQYINPDTSKQAILVDIQHQEPLMRVIGGFLGVLLAMVYFYILPFAGLLGVQNRLEKAKANNPLLKSQFQQAATRRSMFTYVPLKR